jgi:hypothetical protein
MTAVKRGKPSQTFDPENFDIHATEHSIRSKIWPLQKGEHLIHAEKDLKWFKGEEKWSE